VTVTVDGTMLGSNVVFRAVTPYMTIPAGVHTVTVRSATSPSTSPALATGQADVPSGGAVTAAAVAASGSTPSTEAAGAVQLQMFTDDLTAPPAGEAKVRVIHAVPGTPKVTAQLTSGSAPGSASLSANSTLTMSPVGYGQATPYTDVPAGTYQLKIGPTSGTPIVTGQNWPVSAGSVSSIILLAASSGPTIEVLSDAVGAASMPTGAMQTGFGGTAPRPLSPVVPISAAVGLLLLVVAGRRLLWRRRLLCNGR
jgi:hypothetical protein